MSVALQYIWVLPVAIGVVGVWVFAMKDLRSDTPQSKSEG